MRIKALRTTAVTKPGDEPEYIEGHVYDVDDETGEKLIQKKLAEETEEEVTPQPVKGTPVRRPVANPTEKQPDVKPVQTPAPAPRRTDDKK